MDRNVVTEIEKNEDMPEKGNYMPDGWLEVVEELLRKEEILSRGSVDEKGRLLNK